MSPRTTLADVVSGCVAERRLWTPPPPAGVPWVWSARAYAPAVPMAGDWPEVSSETTAWAGAGTTVEAEIVMVFEDAAKATPPPAARARPGPDGMLTNGPSRVFGLLDVIVWTTFCQVALFEPVEMIVWPPPLGVPPTGVPPMLTELRVGCARSLKRVTFTSAARRTRCP